MANVIDMIKIPFKHALYGCAYLVPNTMFNVSEHPTSICYVLYDSNTVRCSSCSDAGLEVTNEVLKQLGY